MSNYPKGLTQAIANGCFKRFVDQYVSDLLSVSLCCIVTESTIYTVVLQKQEGYHGMFQA